jgi:hypothetical protein
VAVPLLELLELLDRSHRTRRLLDDRRVMTEITRTNPGHQGPGKVVAGVWIELIGVDAPLPEVAGRA